jgi:signal transduction histidine kinase
MNSKTDLMNPLPNILIVDDVEDNLFLLVAILQEFEINLIQAYSGTEALEKTKGMKLALAIVDVQMPEMNGYELALKLKEEHLDENVPVIFLTARYTSELDVFKGYDTGAVDFIQKPIANYILQSKIKVFIDLYNQKQTILANTELLTESAHKLTLLNASLELKEDELKKTLDQQHQLALYTQKSLERERKSISRELHDELGQALTSVKIDLSIVKQNFSNANSLVKLEKVIALVGETIKTVRRLTSQLRPEIIDDIGFDAAVEWYASEFAKRNGIEIFLDLDPKIELSTDASLIVYRIMQESLTNISKHAKASRVQIGLGRIGESILFLISDNGIGISESEMVKKQSFGILGMKERAFFLGGTFNISKQPEGGTLIKLMFPSEANTIPFDPKS